MIQKIRTHIQHCNDLVDVQLHFTQLLITEMSKLQLWPASCHVVCTKCNWKPEKIIINIHLQNGMQPMNGMSCYQWANLVVYEKFLHRVQLLQPRNLTLSTTPWWSLTNIKFCTISLISCSSFVSNGKRCGTLAKTLQHNQHTAMQCSTCYKNVFLSIFAHLKVIAAKCKTAWLLYTCVKVMATVSLLLCMVVAAQLLSHACLGQQCACGSTTSNDFDFRNCVDEEVLLEKISRSK